MKLIKLKCENCGADLEVNSELDKINCNFCGAKILIDDNATELRRIEDVKLQARKQNHEQDLKERQEKLEQELKEKEILKKATDKDRFKKSKTSKLLLFIFAIAIILLFANISITAKLFAGLQAVLALGSWLMGMEIVKEPFKGLRIIATIFVFLLIIPVLTESTKEIRYKTINWDYMVLKDRLPKPDGTKGRIITNSDNGLYVYIEGNEDDFREYIQKCKEYGYTIDQDNSTNSYEAKNTDDYSIDIHYYEHRGEYSINLDEPYEPVYGQIGSDTNTNTETNTNNNTETSNTNDNTPTQNTTHNNTTTTNDGLRTDFKEAMDSYESFMNEYVTFMKKFNNNSSDYTLLNEYSKYMSKYNDFSEKFDKWNSENLNEKETKYYIEVQTRVNKKLLEI